MDKLMDAREKRGMREVIGEYTCVHAWSHNSFVNSAHKQDEQRQETDGENEMIE